MAGGPGRDSARGRRSALIVASNEYRDPGLSELRAPARLMMEAKGGPGPKFGFGFGGPPDFDAYDRNADGRLSKEELQGSPWAARFAEIDTNSDGRIDRREWEAYQRKDTDKK